MAGRKSNSKRMKMHSLRTGRPNGISQSGKANRVPKNSMTNPPGKKLMNFK